MGVHYDALIAKLIASGPDRAAALSSLHKGLQQLQVGHEMRWLSAGVPSRVRGPGRWV